MKFQSIWRTWRESKRLQVLALCVGWAGLVGLAQEAGFRPLVGQELGALNFRFRLRGPQPPAPELVIVAIDQRSIGAFDEEHYAKSPELAMLREWPVPRRLHAATIERLVAAGAKVVALDLLFLSPKDDDALMRATITRHRERVVLGGNFSDDGQQLLLPSPVVPESLPTETVAGYVNYWQDSDTSVRRAKFQTYQSAIAGARRLTNESLTLSFDGLIARKYRPDLRLPDWQQDPYINFPGPPGSFPSYPLYQLFYDRAWKENLKNGEVFRDKIVLVGPSGNFEHDSHPTPFTDGRGNTMPGVEIHAAAIATLLHGTAPRDVPPWVDQFTLLALALATAALLNLDMRAEWKLTGLIALSGVYFGAAFAAFTVLGWVIWVAAPLWTVAGGGVLGIVKQVVVEQLEKRRVRQTLERYVSKPVADQILRQDAQYKNSLGGERRALTILFSDIRGFTPLAEQSPPVELVQQLNEYLTAMVAVVMRHDGTLDKFIGDAIMAVFGAPTSQGASADAWCAVQSALEMRQRLSELQELWRAQGREPFKIGIGLNHGEVVVGNIGSPQRMEYTVIGDAVNVASRVEGLNKAYGTDILITESVHALVQDRVEVQLIGTTNVKGRAQAIKIYALKGLRT